MVDVDRVAEAITDAVVPGLWADLPESGRQVYRKSAAAAIAEVERQRAEMDAEAS